MRLVLAMSVLLTAAVGWSSRGPGGVQERARMGRASEPLASETAHAPIALPAPCAEAEGADAAAVEESWIPVRLEVIDGETGAPLNAEATVEARPVQPDARWRSPSEVRCRVEVVVEADVAEPPGYVQDCGFGGMGFISKRANSVRILAPLRREADLRVRVLEADGTPAPRADVLRALLGGLEPDVVPCAPDAGTECGMEVPGDAPAGRCLGCSTDHLADGWLRLRGVPHLLDERLWIVAGDRAREQVAGVILGGFGQRHEAEIRLPAEPTRAVVLYGGSCITFG